MIVEYEGDSNSHQKCITNILNRNDKLVIINEGCEVAKISINDLITVDASEDRKLVIQSRNGSCLVTTDIVKESEGNLVTGRYKLQVSALDCIKETD